VAGWTRVSKLEMLAQQRLTSTSVQILTPEYISTDTDTDTDTRLDTTIKAGDAGAATAMSVALTADKINAQLQVLSLLLLY